MKVEIKKNLIIFRNPYEWNEISSKISKEYGSKIMISWVLKRELGFTIRHHKGLVEHDKDVWEVMKSEGYHNRYHYEDQVHLDFYNEAQMSFFVLKYLNSTDK